MWAMLLLLQDANLADLQKGGESTAQQKACAFSIDRSGAQKQKGKGSVEITGVFASGALYLKYDAFEIVRTNEITLVKIGDGDWKTFAEAKGDVKKPEPDPNAKQKAPPKLTLEELVKIPAPHLLIQKVLGQFKKPTSSPGAGGEVFKGDLSETYARDLPKQEWFGQGDDREWTDTSGSLEVTVNKDHLITLLQFDLVGKILPAAGRGVPRQPNQNPRGAGKFDLPGGTAVVKLKLEEFGSAKLPLPDDAAKKLGVKK